jgi:NAD(P)-dependent dehydrogenase (short-subunit alcohol dehydrogenase family)
MFDEGQQHAHVYHQSKFQSEAVVRSFREQARFRILIYRPSAIIGHSQTGYIDKIDGPYYLFILVSQLKRWIPSVVSIPVLKTRMTLDMVPVDYVVQGLICISQQAADALTDDSFCFHLTNPDSPSLSELFLLLLKYADGPAAGPRIPIDGVTKFLGIKQFKLALQLKAVRMLKKELFDLLKLPESALEALMPNVTFSADRTCKLLKESAIELPRLEVYIETLWQYYSRHLDPYKHRSFYARKAFKGKRVLITGGSSGIGLESAKLAFQHGAHVILVARHADKLAAAEAAIKQLPAEGGQITTYPCDLSDLEACDALIESVKNSFGCVDILYSNAGRSIRRSVSKSEGRFHDLERTMQLNYFGAARLIMGILPLMRQQGSGHIIHSSSMGTLSATPRFGPYMASKIALDTLMDAMAAELTNHNIQFSSIKFPLVKTPMVAPTSAFKNAKLTSPEQAANMFMDTVIDKTRHKLTATGALLGFVAWISPKFMTQLYNYGFQIWPDEPGDFPEMALDRMLMKYFIPNSPL